MRLLSADSRRLCSEASRQVRSTTSRSPTAAIKTPTSCPEDSPSALERSDASAWLLAGDASALDLLLAPAAEPDPGPEPEPADAPTASLELPWRLRLELRRCLLDGGLLEPPTSPALD